MVPWAKKSSSLSECCGRSRVARWGLRSRRRTGCTGFARETFISAPAKYSSQSLPIYFYVFYLLNRNGEPLVNLLFFRRRELLESLLAAPKGSATPFSAITDASGSSS